ncbi:hypothetical protein LXL04_016521 [Taraxacum kok-saghyz]
MLKTMLIGEDEFPADFVDFDWEEDRQKDVDNEIANDEEGDVFDYNFRCTITNSPRGEHRFWLPEVGKHGNAHKNDQLVFGTVNK